MIAPCVNQVVFFVFGGLPNRPQRSIEPLQLALAVLQKNFQVYGEQLCVLKEKGMPGMGTKIHVRKEDVLLETGSSSWDDFVKGASSRLLQRSPHALSFSLSKPLFSLPGLC
jgi:hypothetical protein